ncbi:MAG: hypothetical protein ALAOOOJD_02551 [bacterium]|nr:hypothetical protein [bacterium]
MGTQNIFLRGNLNTQFFANGFDPGTSTFVFNGTGDQFINHNGPPLNNIVINKPSGVVTTYYASTVNGSFTITAGTFTPSYSFTVKGPFTNNGTITSLSGWSFGGDFINNGTFSAGATGLTFNGTAPQTIGGTSATTFGGLSINNPTTVNLTAPITVDGAFTLAAGTFNAGANDITFKGTFTNNASATAFNAGTATVFFSGATQTLGGTYATTFKHLTINSTGSVTLGNSPTITGALTLNSGTLTTGAYTLTVKGDFTNNASATAFNGGTGTVIFNGTAAQAIGGTFPTTFYRLTFNNSAGITLNADPTVNNILTLTSGNITTGTRVLTLGTSGSVTRTSGYIVGNFRKNFLTGSNLTKSFEIGTGTTYTPVSLTFPSVSTAGGVTATTVGSEHPDVINSGLDAAKDVNRY